MPTDFSKLLSDERRGEVGDANALMNVLNEITQNPGDVTIDVGEVGTTAMANERAETLLFTAMCAAINRLEAKAGL